MFSVTLGMDVQPARMELGEFHDSSYKPGVRELLHTGDCSEKKGGCINGVPQGLRSK